MPKRDLGLLCASLRSTWDLNLRSSMMQWILLTPPHPRALAKSFPVPNGRVPTAGGGDTPIWSRTDKTHPTVPSPPHASTRKFGTLRNNSKLWSKNENSETKKIPLSFYSRLTPVLVPPASSQKPDVGLKAIGISVEALRPGCHHFSD